MPRAPKFDYRKTASGWMVNVPASLSQSGKRERHFHKTRDLAKAHAADLREKAAQYGTGAPLIKPSLADDALRAAEILKPWGLTLSAAAQRVAAALEREAASRPIEEAGQAWMDSLEGLRSRSIKSYKVTLNRLLAAHPGRTIASLTADEIQAAIVARENAKATYALHRRNARAFWNWCAKKGWCDKSAFDAVEAPRKGEDKEIEFLSIQEVTALLRTAEEHYPQAVPMYALALFAGIRSEELVRLEAHHVTEHGIELSAEITKKGRRRHITPNLTLSAWLERYPFSPCSNWKQVDCAVRRLAGWEVAAPLLKAAPSPTRGRWSQNALRHSHASYAIAAGTPLESLLFEFGHVGGVEMLRKHYVGRATKKQAVEFFAIGPKTSTLKTLAAV